MPPALLWRHLTAEFPAESTQKRKFGKPAIPLSRALCNLPSANCTTENDLEKILYKNRRNYLCTFFFCLSHHRISGKFLHARIKPHQDTPIAEQKTFLRPALALPKLGKSGTVHKKVSSYSLIQLFTSNGHSQPQTSYFRRGDYFSSSALRSLENIRHTHL